jgi:hypothetical protein
MRWLWFVASAICFAVVFRTHSMGLAALSLLAALVFVLVGVVALVSGRIDSRARDASTLMGPEEMRRLREIEQKKRESQAAAAAASPGPSLSSGSVSPRDRVQDNDSIPG